MTDINRTFTENEPSPDIPLVCASCSESGEDCMVLDEQYGYDELVETCGTCGSITWESA